MPTGTADTTVREPMPPWLMATEPVDGIHDYNIPIPHHKLPPGKDEYPKPRRRRQERDRQRDPAGGKDAPRPDGHIDDYA